jgi:hypothetical protein
MYKFFIKFLKNLLNILGYSIINNNQKIVEISDKHKYLINITNSISMTPQIRRYNLIQALEYVSFHNLDGDFVECGVWKGGNIVIYKKFMDEKNMKKNIYAFDTFEGMNEPCEYDFDINSKVDAKTLLDNEKNRKSNLWGVCSLDNVKANISMRTNDLNNIFFVKGKVEETLLKKENLPKKVSILRLDTDFYNSTKIELETLYKKVTKGGVVIIDDYGHWGGV